VSLSSSTSQCVGPTPVDIKTGSEGLARGPFATRLWPRPALHRSRGWCHGRSVVGRESTQPRPTSPRGTDDEPGPCPSPVVGVLFRRARYPVLALDLYPSDPVDPTEFSSTIRAFLGAALLHYSAHRPSLGSHPKSRRSGDGSRTVRHPLEHPTEERFLQARFFRPWTASPHPSRMTAIDRHRRGTLRYRRFMSALRCQASDPSPRRPFPRARQTLPRQGGTDGIVGEVM